MIACVERGWACASVTPEEAVLRAIGKADVRRVHRILVDLTRPENIVFSVPIFYAPEGKKEGVK